MNKYVNFSIKIPHLTSTAYRLLSEKTPFWRVVHFGVFHEHKKSPYVHKKRETKRVTILVIIFRTATFVGDIQRFNELAN